MDDLADGFTRDQHYDVGAKNTSANGSPDTVGLIFQADYTPFGKADSWGRPFANVRVGLQYTVYTKYDGASTNYDGTGRNASDNNTLYLFVWMAM